MVSFILFLIVNDSSNILPGNTNPKFKFCKDTLTIFEIYAYLVTLETCILLAMDV